MSDSEANKLPRANTSSVLLQLAREMGFPSLIAAGWTLYSLIVTPSKRNLVDAIPIFGGTFFLASWAFSQWFRVRKQQAVERGLGGIVSKQEALVKALTAATDRLVGHASGGTSFGWLNMAAVRDGAVRDITAHVEGDYPLLDAKANVMNLDSLVSAMEVARRTQNVQDVLNHYVGLDLGTLQPKIGSLFWQAVPCDTTKPLLRFQVDWTARNGVWTQVVQLKRRGHGFHFSTAVKREGEWIFEDPPRHELPKREDGSPDVFWLPKADGEFLSHG